MFLRYLSLICALLGFSFTAAAADFTHTLKRIDDSGVINLGYRVDQTPMAFDSGSNKAAGYSVDLCNQIAIGVKKKLERTDIRVNNVPVTAENRFDAIESGKIDILCGATTKTLSRSEIVGFTQTTFVTGGALLSRNSAPVEKLEDLAGKQVAVVSGTTTIAALNEAIEALAIDAEVIPVSSTSQGMSLLERNEVDVLAADQVVLIGQVISRGEREKYALSKDLFSFEPFALAIARGDPDFKLVADRVLSGLNRSGAIVKIYGKWFGSFGKNPPDMLQALYLLNSTPP